MLEDNDEFVAWEEHNISQERGNRVIHFFLRNSKGNLVLAVEGTERSIRHMMYVISEDFVDKYGPTSYIKAGTKWRARRDVIDWLSLVVSRHQSRLESSACNLVQPIHDNDRLCRSSGHLTPQPPDTYPRRLKAQISDIVWHGVSWACSKQLIHYPAFRRNGTTVSVHSFVFIMAAEGSHYLGYLEDMYEDKKRQKKVRVRWFHRDEEVLSIVSRLNAHPREVFITPHVQVISAECIDGLAAVLTPKHYEQCTAVIPHSILSKVHMCFRQFKNNKIKPFSISKLQGYSKQALLTCIDHPLFTKNKIQDSKFNDDKQGTSTLGDGMKRGHKRKSLDGGKNEDSKERDQIKVDNERKRLYTPEGVLPLSHRSKDLPSCRRLRIKLSGRVLKHDKFVEPELSASFKINDKIELLCQDSGVRGCWFRCKVLQISGSRLKVQYDDVQDAEDSGNLQEWVASCRMANPDKFGQRCSGRLTIRPRPPEDSAGYFLDVGTPVEVWWCDGWWEGVVTMTSTCGTDHLQIYLSGEDRYVTTEKSKVRTARDWVNGSWVNAKMKPDILSCISVKASSNRSRCAMPPISELEEIKLEQEEQPGTATHDAVLTSIEDDTILKRRFEQEGDVDTEVGKQPAKESVSHDADTDGEDDTLAVENEPELPRQQYTLTKSIEVTNS